MDIIRTIHGELRWVVLIVAIVIAIKFTIGWLGKREYQPIDRSLLLIYTVVLDINVVLGLVLLFSLGIDATYRIEHAVMMILAVIAAHMSSIWQSSDDAVSRYRNQLLMVLVSMVFIFMGVVRLRSVLYDGAGFF